jgi:arsenate reductase
MRKQTKIRVMFVCLGNACRSPMAEAVARKEASDILEISSGGLTPMGFLPEMTLETLTRNGYPTEALASKPIRPEVLLNTDLVLNMSGQTRAHALAAASQIEHWPVPDPYGEDEDTYQTILEDIQGRVRELSARLRKAHQRNDQAGEKQKS